MTPDPRLQVPAELAGPLAALIHWALPRARADMGGPVPAERELRALRDSLRDAVRDPLPQSAMDREAVCESDLAALVPLAEAAARTGRRPRTLRWQCDQERVRGAVQIGGLWFIPEVWVTNRVDEDQEDAA